MVVRWQAGTVAPAGHRPTLRSSADQTCMPGFVPPGCYGPTPALASHSEPPSQVSIAEVAAAWKEVHGRELPLRRLGSVDDLNAELERRRQADPANWASYVPLNYQLTMFGGSGKLRNVANDRWASRGGDAQGGDNIGGAPGRSQPVVQPAARSCALGAGTLL